MTRTKRSQKMKKIAEQVVGEDPSQASVAYIFLHRRSNLDNLERLASNLNEAQPDSLAQFIAELVERLIACPPTKQDWVGDPPRVVASLPSPLPWTPAPESPLYVLNKFLERNPVILRIEGVERIDDSIGVHATHIPLPWGVLVGHDDLSLGLTEQRILWSLWEVLYHGVDLKRLKKCTVCNRWFVDHTKNGSKVRCTARCTSRSWSWGERKKAGHKLRGVKTDTPRTRSRNLSRIGHGSDTGNLSRIRWDSSIRS